MQANNPEGIVLNLCCYAIHSYSGLLKEGRVPVNKKQVPLCTPNKFYPPFKLGIVVESKRD